MPTKVKIRIISSPNASDEPWTFDNLEVKPGDTVSWEPNGQELLLFFPYRDLFEGLSGIPDERVIAIGKEQRILELKVKAGRLQEEETGVVPYAIFHAVEAEGSAGVPRGKMIIKRSGRRASPRKRRGQRG
ncbi:MAG: hypothetical protein ACRENG_17265 [bacterium]